MSTNSGALEIKLTRARQGFVTARTAQSNQLRGLPSEFGIVMPTGISRLKAADAAGNGRQLAAWLGRAPCQHSSITQFLGREFTQNSP
jgi:transposase